MDYDKILAKVSGGSAGPGSGGGINYDDILAKLTGSAKPSPSLTERAVGALPLGSDFSEGYGDAINSSLSTLSKGYANLNKEGMDKVIGTGQLALGGLEYLASPFAGAGRLISNPIRRAAEGVPGSSFVADTAELAPMMFAPFPGARSIKSLGAGAGAVMGESPAAMTALENTFTMLKPMLGRTGQAPIEAAPPPVRPSQMERGNTAQTSQMQNPTNFMNNAFRETNVPGLMEEGPALNRQRTSSIPGDRSQAPEDWYRDITSDPRAMYEPQMGSEPPAGPFPSEVEGMRLPNIRNQPLDPVTQQQMELQASRNQMTSPMMSRLTDQPTDYDALYAQFFNKDMSPARGMGQEPLPSGRAMAEVEPVQPGLTKYQPPRVTRGGGGEPEEFLGGSGPGAPKPRTRVTSKAVPYDAPMVNSEPMPEGVQPGGFGTQEPRTDFRDTGEQAGRMKDRPARTNRDTSGEVLQMPGSNYYNWDDKNPALFGKPAPVSPPQPTGTTDPNTLSTRLKTFKGGPVTPEEVPPMAQPNPTMNTGVDVGTNVDLVHKFNGQEMRVPGGKIVGTITKEEPVYGKPTRDAKGNMVSGMKTQSVDYVILEDGREVPRSIVQPASASAAPTAKKSGFANPPAEPKLSARAPVAKSTEKSGFTNPPEGAKEGQFDPDVSEIEHKHSTLMSNFENSIAGMEKLRDELANMSKLMPKAEEKTVHPELQALRDKFEKARDVYAKNRENPKAQKNLIAANKAIEDYHAVKKIESEPPSIGTYIPPEEVRAMRGEPAAVDNKAIMQGVRTAFKTADKASISHEYIMNYLPEGTTKEQLNNVLQGMSKTDKGLVLKENAVTFSKLTPSQRDAASKTAVAANFHRGLAALRKELTGDTSYLYNFTADKFDAAGSQMKNARIIEQFNKMISDGKLQVHGENSGKVIDKLTAQMISKGEHNDEDLLITFLKDD